MSEGSNLSRRDFLKLVGGSVAAGILAGTGIGKFLFKTFGTPEPPKVEPNSASEPTAIKEQAASLEPLTLTPEIVSGVEVYGLKEKIASADDIAKFYSSLNSRFAKTNNIRIGDVVRQQKELLNPNERYLEVTVRRSAYDSFIQKQAETGVNFPEWIKMHVDVMNRCIKEAVPPVELKAVLRRILIIEDDMPKDFWDEDAYRQGKPGSPALDWAWLLRFGSPVSIDTDESWAVADDYRKSGGGNFWEVRHENGKIVIGMPPGTDPFNTFYEFPEESDSLTGKNNVKFDMGIIHEWCHYLLNLPDEYAQDVHDTSQRFRDFTFGTGSFEVPYVSPYLAYLMRNNISFNRRNAFGDDNQRAVNTFENRPGKVEIIAQSQNKNLANGRVEASRVRLLDGSYYGNKSVPQNADEISRTNSLNFDNKLFKDDSNCWLLKLTNDFITSEVFLPAAAFNMSKIAGLESASYNLTFSGYDDTERTYQEVMLVEDANIDEYLKNSQDPFYAKMKVEGTNT